MTVQSPAISEPVLAREIRRLTSLVHEAGTAPADREHQEDLHRRIEFLNGLTEQGLLVSRPSAPDGAERS